MTTDGTAIRREPGAAARALERAGGAILRYGVAFFLVWFGAFKFTAAEAKAIRPLIEHSPAMAWMYALWSQQTVSNLIGVAELAVAALILARPLWPRVSAAGSVAAAATFATTLSFLVTTPGSWALVEGFPVPAGAGGFVVKDLFLFGAALWSAGEAWRSGLRADRDATICNASAPPA